MSMPVYMVLHNMKIELFFGHSAAEEFIAKCKETGEEYSLHICSLQDFGEFMETTFRPDHEC